MAGRTCGPTGLTSGGGTTFKAEIIEVMSGLGEAYRAYLTPATSRLWQGDDPAIRRAIVDAVLIMGPAPVETNPTSAGAGPTRNDTPSGRARTRSSPER